MQQATVNLLADMGAQPATLIAGLVAGDAVDRHDAADLDDHLAAAGATLAGRQRGRRSPGPPPTAAAAWSPASRSPPTAAAPGIRRRSPRRRHHGELVLQLGRARHPTTTIVSRAADDSGNLESPVRGLTVNVGCPCSIWGTDVTPATADCGRRRARSSSACKFTLRRLRHGHGRPLLQGRGQHRHPRREPVDARAASSSPRPRSPARPPPAGSRSTSPARSRSAPTRPTSPLPRPQRALRGDLGYFFTAAPDGRQRARRPPLHALREREQRERRLRLQPATRLPHVHLRGHQLLGRRRLHAPSAASARSRTWRPRRG